jgi:hypothetical protein
MRNRVADAFELSLGAGLDRPPAIAGQGMEQQGVGDLGQIIGDGCGLSPLKARPLPSASLRD